MELRIERESELREEVVAIRARKPYPEPKTWLRLLTSRFLFEKASSSDLATLINSAPFTSIDLGSVKAEGSMAVLHDSIARSSELNYFTWAACASGAWPWPDAGDVEALGNALGQLTKLQRLTIGFDGQDPLNLRLATLGMGIGPVNIQPSLDTIRPFTVVLPSLQRPNHDIHTISFTSGNFQVLPSHDSVGFQDLRHFFTACQTSTTLCNLNLLFGPDFEGFPATAVGMALQLIRESSSLQLFKIRFAQVESLLEFAEDLKHNQSLKDLRIELGKLRSNPAPISKEETAAFHATLRHHNFTLKNLEILPWIEWKSRPTDPWRAVRRLEHCGRISDEVQNDLASIYFFMYLNGCRREGIWSPQDYSMASRSLQRAFFLGPAAPLGASQEDWLCLIAHYKHDASAIFYYLRNHLSLFHYKPGNNKRQCPSLDDFGQQKKPAAQSKKRKVVNRTDSTGSSAADAIMASFASVVADAQELTPEQRIAVAASMRLAAAKIEM